QITAVSWENGPPSSIRPPSSSPPADPDRTTNLLCTHPGILGARLRARCRGVAVHRVLIFVDQFEELYTLGAGADEQAAFVACLLGAADDASSPLRVMLSIRSDFVDRMAEDRKLMGEASPGLWFLAPMGRAALREALMRPVDTAGYRFESDA